MLNSPVIYCTFLGCVEVLPFIFMLSSVECVYIYLYEYNVVQFLARLLIVTFEK